MIGGIIKNKVGLLKLAESLGSVSRANPCSFRQAHNLTPDLPGHLLCGHNQRVGRIYQQTFLDTRQLAWDKILDREAPTTAATAP